jgi:hypothetical protein
VYHLFFGLNSRQLRDRIGLIQAQLASGEHLSEPRQILETTGHPDQLRRRGMSQPEAGTYPLRKVASPVGQELLAGVGFHQPFTDLGVENGQTRE